MDRWPLLVLAGAVLGGVMLGGVMLGGVMLGGVMLGGVACGQTSGRVDSRAWASLPVLHAGRIKPLDTFARGLVNDLCGSENPRLPYPDFNPRTTAEAAGLDRAKELFPDGKPRRFTAPELLLSWLVEPETWEYIPFLAAGNEQLRADVLSVAVRDDSGARLAFVSPYQVAKSTRFYARLQRLAERGDDDSQPARGASAELDRKTQQLAHAYNLFRMAVFGSSDSDGDALRHNRGVMPVLQAWQEVASLLQQIPMPDDVEAYRATLRKADAATDSLGKLFRRDEGPTPTTAQIETALASLAEASQTLARQVAAQAARFDRQDRRTDAQKAAGAKVEAGSHYRLVAGRLAEVARRSDAASMGLYDSPQALYIAPALNAAALEKDRAAEEIARPWLSLQAVMVGSDALMKAYPREELNAVRRAWRDVVDAQTQRGRDDRPERLWAALDGFAGAVRSFGEKIEPLREPLPIRSRDKALIVATAYPPADATRLEVLYNRVDPLEWLWIFSLSSVACFAFGRWLPRAAFWSGLLLLAAAQVAAVGGLSARAVITGFAPVGNMFETIVFVALLVALLGTCFTLLPLVQRGLRSGWRLSAIPGTPEAANAPQPSRDDPAPGAGRLAQALALASRAALTVGVFWFLVFVPYGGSGEGYTTFNLKPIIAQGASLPTLSNFLSWIVVLALLALSLWLAPRVIVAAAAALASIRWTPAQPGKQGPLAEAFARKPFAWVGAAVASLAGYIACNTTLFSKGLSPLMPVIRDNFWLTWHVKTIVGGYAAGALAWGLANLAFCCYLLGTYRDQDVPVSDLVASGKNAPQGRMPVRTGRVAPDFCGLLAGYNYRAMQVAVVLLSAGTLLGAVWADRAWGRFWGWDPKEIWALISILVYLGILHCRYVRWVGDFGMAVGAVLGAAAIVVAWFWVNAAATGSRHSYGSGAETGSGMWLLGIGLANSLLIFAAGVRYLAEKNR